MNHKQKIITLLKRHTKNKPETILLGSSAYVTFCKPKLWNELIKPTGIFKTYHNFCYHIDQCVRKGWLRVLNNGSKGNHGQKTFEITDKGISLLPQDVYTYIQLLIDNSSEEVDPCVCQDLDPCDESVPNDVTTQEIQSTEQPSESDKIIYMCNLLEQILLSKNASYGNSSLKPLGIFDLPRLSKIQARLEDKISRLGQVSRSGNKDAIRDTLLDLAGYSILYLIALEEE